MVDHYLIRSVNRATRKHGWCYRHGGWNIYWDRRSATKLDSLRKTLRVLKTSRGLEQYRRWHDFEIIEVHDDGFEQKVCPIETVGDALKALGAASE